jgi:uncharacterized membrane protein
MRIALLIWLFLSVAAPLAKSAHSAPFAQGQDAAPRAWLVGSVISIEDRDAAAFLDGGRVNPGQTAVLPPPVRGQGRPVGLEDGWLANTDGSQTQVEQVARGFLRIRVSSSGGLLVVEESWAPGWEATVVRDGSRQSAPLLRANLSLLGVPVGPGEVTVELRYRPLRAQPWLPLAALALLALAALAWPVSRRRLAALLRRLARSKIDAYRVALLLITLIGFALRTLRLDYAELRGDEALGYLFSLERLGNLISSTIALKEPHPVASYAVQGAWIGLAGHTEFALRFVSAWFGALAVPLVYALARRLGLPRLTAALAAAFIAVSPYAIWHSQDARMYSISLALTLGSTVLMLRALTGGQRSAWVAYVAVTWLALQTHYYAAYIVVAQNLFVFGRGLVSADERRRLLPWLAAQAATGLLYLPWLIAARSTLTGYVGNGDSPGLVAMWLRSLSVFAVGETLPPPQRELAAYFAALLALWGAYRLFRSGARGRRALWLAAVYLVAPLMITWAGALSRPIFNERYIIAALPGFALLAAAAVSPARAMPERASAGGLRGVPAWLGAALGALLLAVMLLSLRNLAFEPSFSKSSGWRHLAAVMGRFTQGSEPAVTRAAQNFPDPTLWYYYQGPAAHAVIPPAPNDRAAADALVGELVDQGVRRVVIAAAPSANWDSSGIAGAALEAEFARSQEVAYGNWNVLVYDRPPDAIAPADALFSNGLRLTAAAPGQARLTPGDALPVYLQWDAAAAELSGTENLTLQLLDAEGRVAAQTDRALTALDFDEAGAAYVIWLPRTLRDGRYRLILALYDPGKEGAPRLLTPDGADHVGLAELDSSGAERLPFK